MKKTFYHWTDQQYTQFLQQHEFSHSLTDWCNQQQQQKQDDLEENNDAAFLYDAAYDSDDSSTSSLSTDSIDYPDEDDNNDTVQSMYRTRQTLYSAPQDRSISFTGFFIETQHPPLIPEFTRQSILPTSPSVATVYHVNRCFALCTLDFMQHYCQERRQPLPNTPFSKHEWDVLSKSMPKKTHDLQNYSCYTMDVPNTVCCICQQTKPVAWNVTHDRIMTLCETYQLVNKTGTTAASFDTIRPDDNHNNTRVSIDDDELCKTKTTFVSCGKWKHVTECILACPCLQPDHVICYSCLKDWILQRKQYTCPYPFGSAPCNARWTAEDLSHIICSTDEYESFQRYYNRYRFLPWFDLITCQHCHQDILIGKKKRTEWLHFIPLSKTTVHPLLAKTTTTERYHPYQRPPQSSCSPPISNTNHCQQMNQLHQDSLCNKTAASYESSALSTKNQENAPSEKLNQANYNLFYDHVHDPYRMGHVFIACVCGARFCYHCGNCKDAETKDLDCQSQQHQPCQQEKDSVTSPCSFCSRFDDPENDWAWNMYIRRPVHHVSNYYGNDKDGPCAHLLRNKEITLEIAWQHFTSCIETFLSTKHVVAQCFVCQQGLHKTMDCNAMSHCQVEQCYVCGYTTPRGGKIPLHHWDSNGVYGCPRYDDDPYWNKSFEFEPIKTFKPSKPRSHSTSCTATIHQEPCNFKCRQDQCYNHCNECPYPSHQQGIEKMRLRRLQWHIRAFVQSLPLKIRMQFCHMYYTVKTNPTHPHAALFQSFLSVHEWLDKLIHCG